MNSMNFCLASCRKADMTLRQLKNKLRLAAFSYVYQCIKYVGDEFNYNMFIKLLHTCALIYFLYILKTFKTQ